MPTSDEERLRLLEQLREPPANVTNAMAAEQAAGAKRNGHGNHAYRDMWIAGVDALIKELR